MRRWVTVVLIGLLLTPGLFAQKAEAPVTSPGVKVEELQKHLGELEDAREQALANLHAIDGAIQECKYWIKRAQAEPGKPELKRTEPAPPAQ